MKMATTIILVVDVETTGLPPDAAVCEIGWQEVFIEDGKPQLGQLAGSLINPRRTISPAASAIHHIVDADVKDKPDFDSIYHPMEAAAGVLAAHNASFEQQFCVSKKPWICTLKTARRVWPEAPGHSNQILRYWRNLLANRDIASPAHRARPDAYVTGLILMEFLNAGVTTEQMVKWTEEPSFLPHVEFGKHRGKKWPELPIDYLQWITRSDMEEDYKFTAKHWLAEHFKKVNADRGSQDLSEFPEVRG